jgi:large subunit ribosomal protein L6
MSRIGKLPIKIENGVTVEVQDGGRFGYKKVVVKGPKGELSQDIRHGVKISVENGAVKVERDSDSKMNRSYHGLYRTLIANAVEGVTKGYSKELEIVGVGYRGALKGTDLELNIGYTHPVVVKPIPGISFAIKDQVFVTVSGIDKHLVGHMTAKIRELRKPEPYKGKGIRYKGEYVRRKAGKAAASAS